MIRSDLMDASEVAAHYGVALSSLRVALTAPTRNPALARRLPEPMGKVGGKWVWRRSDVEGKPIRRWLMYAAPDVGPSGEFEAVAELSCEGSALDALNEATSAAEAGTWGVREMWGAGEDVIIRDAAKRTIPPGVADPSPAYAVSHLVAGDFDVAD